MVSRRSGLLGRLVRIGGRNRIVLVEALLGLVAASLAIKLLPFRRTAELMRVDRPQRALDPVARDRIIARCRWAVTAWADRVPWRAVCFQRGLALHLMLRRRGIGSVLHYGVSQDEEAGLRAHVWVDAGDRTVMGGEEAPNFARLASFPAARG